MNTEKTFETDSLKFEDTLELGFAIGSRLRGGELFELVGDLGTGKTGLVRSIVKGVGSADEVSSPSFTISNVYTSGTLTINHFDFYRLTEAGILTEELGEVLKNPDNITLIEWGEVVHDVLPKKRIKVVIEHRGGDSRHLIFTYPDIYDYLFYELGQV